MSAGRGFGGGISVVFSSRRRHTRYWRDWSSDVCSSDLDLPNHVAHSFLPARLFPKAAHEDFSAGSLYEYLRREYSADLAHARIVVDVGTAAPDEADLLRVVAGSPLLVVRKIGRAHV